MDPNRHRRGSTHDEIRLDPEGNWYQGEYPVLHDRTIQFLYKNIDIDKEGKYFLTGEDKPIFFRVEDVPYWIIKIERTIAGYLITLTDETVELLNLHSLWTGKKNALYCLIKGGKYAAKFFRSPYYEITKDLQKKGDRYYLLFGGKKYAIQKTPPSHILSLGKKGAKAKPKKKKHGVGKKKKKGKR